MLSEHLHSNSNYFPINIITFPEDNSVSDLFHNQINLNLKGNSVLNIRLYKTLTLSLSLQNTNNQRNIHIIEILNRKCFNEIAKIIKTNINFILIFTKKRNIADVGNFDDFDNFSVEQRDFIKKFQKISKDVFLIQNLFDNGNNSLGNKSFEERVILIDNMKISNFLLNLPNFKKSNSYQIIKCLSVNYLGCKVFPLYKTKKIDFFDSISVFVLENYNMLRDCKATGNFISIAIF